MSSNRYSKKSPLHGYQSYIKHLQSLVATAISANRYSEIDDLIQSALDGQAAQELRRLVPIEILRRDGIFLTGAELAQRALQSILTTLNSESVILDPACGAGDLLLACIEALPAQSSLDATIQEWERLFIGRDLHSELVYAASLRLFLAGIRRFPDSGKNFEYSERRRFPRIRPGCGLSEKEIYKRATHIVMNPPFAPMLAPDSCDWAGGKVNSAAVFLENALRRARPGTRVAAILPEVLRSGSRYRKWRNFVESRAHVDRMEIGGQFNHKTDIHFFILTLRVHQQVVDKVNPTVNWTRAPSRRSLGEKFAVRIGPVVDYRDPHKGQWQPFICPRELPPWESYTPSRSRRFKGTLVTPPFVAIRRTSRPGDLHRAVGTLVVGSRPVAVENHIIYLRPNDGQRSTCETAIKNLKDPRSSEWLDQKIRCRHLTVSALSELPWWSNGHE